MKVLVACEESQTVCKAFRAKGHEAFSCDILPCSGGHPEWHIQDDVLKHLHDGWDMMIAHPPCTYLTNAGARHLYPKGKLDEKRKRLGLRAADFFYQLWDARFIHKRCIENPTPSKIFGLPPCNQIIQPFMFGHPVSKRTQLWIDGVPLLKPTNLVPSIESTKLAGNWFNKGGIDRQKNRSKTFQGIADAMADQWGSISS
jgi:hypothetical protein